MQMLQDLKYHFIVVNIMGLKKDALKQALLGARDKVKQIVNSGVVGNAPNVLKVTV
jgi:hypothetical protein